VQPILPAIILQRNKEVQEKKEAETLTGYGDAIVAEKRKKCEQIRERLDVIEKKLDVIKNKLSEKLYINNIS